MKSAALLPLLLLLVSCATMVNETTQDISVGSEPEGAVVTVECGNAPLYGGETPVVLTLERKATPCALTIAKEGFVPQHVTLARVPACPPGSKKYPSLFGPALATDDGDVNMCWALTDPYDRRTGAPYKHMPGSVFVKLSEAQAQ